MVNCTFNFKKLENSLHLVENVPAQVQFRSLGGTVLINRICHTWIASWFTHQCIFHGARHYVSGNTPSHIFFYRFGSVIDEGAKNTVVVRCWRFFVVTASLSSALVPQSLLSPLFGHFVIVEKKIVSSFFHILIWGKVEKQNHKYVNLQYVL